MDLKFRLSLFARRLPWFGLMLALGGAAGLALAVMLPPAYVARATLIVESEQIPADLAESTVRTGAGEALQIIRHRIMTRARLIDMAADLDIYATRPADDAIVRDLRDRIEIRTTGGRSGAQATVVTVGFRARTAPLAARVATALVTAILRENVAIRTGVAGQTLAFFEAEVERLDRDLTRRGAEILAFQERNLDALPDSLDFRRSQQAAAQERLTQLDRDGAALRDRRDRLVTLARQTGKLAATESAEMRQLRGLEEELASALAVLSPQNPRVRLMRSRIAALETGMARKEMPIEPPVPMAEHGLRIADIDGQLGFIAERKRQVRARMAALQHSIAATPANAIALAGLQRDFDAVRQQYEQAVRARARAVTGDTLEAMSKGQRITVVEPAIAPQRPESPNRPAIVAAGLGGGLLMGIGLLWLLETLNTAVRRPEDLVARLCLTPFGTLPYLRTDRQVRRRRATRVGAALLLLAGLSGGAWWALTQAAPPEPWPDRAAERMTRPPI
ncbi:GumC family protein [Limimaricola sp.]|uniref:GumC family protein n=1 Tax=Limimaricola sp. TaxID=2211665 RepID=UPI0040583C8F